MALSTRIARLEKLGFAYPETAVAAVADVSLELEPGEVVLVLGRSGSGKSTLIRALAGLVPHFHGGRFSGSVNIAGRDTRSTPPAVLAGTVATLFQDPEDQIVFERVASEVAFGPENLGLAPGEVAERVESSLAAVGAGHLLERKTRDLSGGELQRVCLASALALQPELLLLDEPTAGLDPLVQQTFFAVMREAVTGGGTVFLSSHILSEVERSCDRVAIIREGRLVQVDRVDALRDLAHHQVELRFAGDPPAGEFAGIPGVSDVQVEDHLLRLRVFGPITPVVMAAARLGVTDFLSREPSLEDTFLAQYGHAGGAPAGEAPAREVK